MVEIVIDTGTNGDLLFHPTGDRVRGAFSPGKVASSEPGTLHRDLPNGVPGQVIRFDPTTNTGSIVEPLQDPANAGIKEAIVKRLSAGSAFSGTVEFPVSKEYANAHAGTWLGWMRRAVASGSAKLTKGKLPESDPPDMRRSFYTVERTDPKDDLIKQLVGLLTAKLSPTEKKELAGLIGSK